MDPMTAAIILTFSMGLIGVIIGLYVRKHEKR